VIAYLSATVEVRDCLGSICAKCRPDSDVIDGTSTKRSKLTSRDDLQLVHGSK
jgi:hypothetical protein